MELKEFQQAGKKVIIDKLLSQRTDSTLFIMPPGTGKTVLVLETLKEAFLMKLIRNAVIINYHKALQEFLKKAVSERGIEDKVTVMTAYSVKQLINEQKVDSSDYDLIVFEELDDHINISPEIFDFFTGMKWGLANTEAEAVLAMFNKQLHEVDFRVTFDVTSGKLSYNNFVGEKDYKQILIDSIKSSLINYGSNEVDSKYYNQEYKEILEYVLKKEISIEGIKSLVYKKKQLEEFKALLNNEEYFDSELIDGKKPESVWQSYFERNAWIFGLGFNFLFNASLEGKKLEQVVEGFSIKGSGKRVDALLRTRGLIGSFYFGEIKTHRKNLLKANKIAYRADSWMISEELSGAVAQLQKTIYKSISNIGNALRIKNADGFFTGETIYLIKPKSFLLIGSLNEFKQNNEIHEEKFISFELFRRSLNDIEILTFDELYERAVAVIE